LRRGQKKVAAEGWKKKKNEQKKRQGRRENWHVNLGKYAGFSGRTGEGKAPRP